jgi:hypothetical protein
MIKLSDVKVRPLYRTRVRYRLLVLEYAWQHGASRRGSPLRLECSDDSAVAETLASRRRRGAGAGLSSAPGAAGAARCQRRG